MLNNNFINLNFILRNAFYKPLNKNANKDFNKQFKLINIYNIGLIKNINKNSLYNINIKDLNKIKQGFAKFQ